MNLRRIAAGLLGACLAVPAMAAETEPPERPPKESEEPGQKPPKKARTPPEAQTRKAAELAARYGVTQEEVAALREKGMGWGEIKHALAISEKAGVPLSEVVKLRQDGMGWGQVAQHYGFKLGEATGKKGAAIEPPREEPPSRDAMRGSGRQRGAERGRGADREKGRPGVDRGRGPKR